MAPADGGAVFRWRRAHPPTAAIVDRTTLQYARGGMRVAVFTARSVGIGVAAGMLVAVALGQLVGSAWGLAVLTGLAAGALALAVAVGVRDGRFDFLGANANQRRLGVWTLAYLVMVTPMFFVDDAMGSGCFDGRTNSRSVSCSGSPDSPRTPSAASWRR